MTAAILRGDATRLPLADGTVNLVVTSPPYWSLRSYQDGGQHYAGQLGSEPTPHLFLANLWRVMDECWRVLRADGSAWVNLGDKYAGSNGNNQSGLGDKRLTDATVTATGHRGGPRGYISNKGGLRPKSRMLLPHQFAIGAQDPDYRAFTEHRAGLQPRTDYPQWICRSDVVWSKPNGLPESVTDRVRASHEYWFHLVKSERYYAAVDAVREAIATRVDETRPVRRLTGGEYPKKPTIKSPSSPLGKLPGSVWTVPTEPLQPPAHIGVDHFAAFPSFFPRRIILGWSPSGVCTACGEGRRPTSSKTLIPWHDKAPQASRYVGTEKAHGNGRKAAGDVMATTYGRNEVTITGEACVCPTPDAPTRPAIVLDPFSGTGTVAAVAHILGRHGVGVELSGDYNRLAEWRINDPALRAKVLEVERPRTESPGQLDIFGGEAA